MLAFFNEVVDIDEIIWWEDLSKINKMTELSDKW